MRILISRPQIIRHSFVALLLFCASRVEVVFLAKNKEWHAPNPLPARESSLTVLIAQVEVKHSILTCVDLNPVFSKVRPFSGMSAAKSRRLDPGLDLNHVGFGNGLYLNDVFPEAKRIGLFEWFYRSIGADVDFYSKAQLMQIEPLRLRTWNAQTLLELADCDIGVVPTHWQKQQFPDHLSSRLCVIHEGVEVSLLKSLETNRLESTKHSLKPRY